MEPLRVGVLVMLGKRRSRGTEVAVELFQHRMLLMVLMLRCERRRSSRSMVPPRAAVLVTSRT